MLRITIVKNAEQTKKAVILVPATDSIHAAVLTLAKNKLRLRSPKRIFSADGAQVADSAQLLEMATQFQSCGKEITFLISVGEDYIGKVAAPVQQSDALVAIICDQSDVEESAIKQLKTVAQLEGMRFAIGMPDLHPGNKHPIGAVFGSVGKVYPSLIGSDIGCGMMLSKSSLPVSLCEQAERIASRLESGGLDSSCADEQITARLEGLEPSNFDSSLGTIGAGNHFAEILKIHEVSDQSALDMLGMPQNILYILAHSRSRGLGQYILDTTEGSSLDDTSEAFLQYKVRHDHAVEWACRSRRLITDRVLELLKPLDVAEVVVDVTHNFVEQIEGGIWVHRKGATPNKRENFCIIPGSRGACSFFVKCLGGSMQDGLSLAHGAGRSLSRAKALAKNQKRYQHDLGALRRTELGSIVVCGNKNLLYEEAPDAYKDIEKVVADLESRGLIKVVCSMHPVVTYKC